MEKKKIRALFLIISFVVVLIVVFQLSIGHSIRWNDVANNYLFLFKDSIICKIDTAESSSWVSNQDIMSNFVYFTDLKDKKLYYEPSDTSYTNYYVTIWDFKSLKNYSLDNVFINTNSEIHKSEFEWEETDTNGDFPVSIKYLYKIDGMILNVSNDSKIIKEYHEKKYIGFYGLINKMSICNNNGEPQVYFNSKEGKLLPTIILFYRSKNAFYFIMIKSNKRIDENIISILNLN